MYTAVRKMFLAALPLAGLLMLPYPVLAHDNNDRDRHEDYHDWRKDLHREYHQYPSSGRSHRRFHRWLDREHSDFHNDWSDSYYNRHDRGRHRGWYGNRDWYGNGNYRDGRWYYPYR